MNELMEMNWSRIQADIVYVCKNDGSASSFVHAPFVLLYRWLLNSAVLLVERRMRNTKPYLPSISLSEPYCAGRYGLLVYYCVTIVQLLYYIFLY